MTCPICAYQANPDAKLERGTVCDVHADDFFPLNGKPLKSAEQLIAKFSIPSDHYMASHIRDTCKVRDHLGAFIKDLASRGQK